MKKHLTLIALLGALFATAGITAAHAETDTKPAAKKKVVKKAPAKKAAAAAAAPAAKMPFSSDAEDDDSEPELGGTLSADFQCEMGHKLTIWKNEADDKHIAIRWDKRIHRLTRVETTTGANRFENRKMGLVWIGIPAKGLLLDSKKGQQLANECKNAEQIKAAAAASAAPAATVAAAPQKN
ncbi:hypothetical protein [Herbaspirillum camelliae]|uniref:hypothetical protein n=1 Tax=Herbaspirillum camelliae TaxID=1892903 RepID=UPI000949C55D|nr:hypothetical protein [Herbaspirillum camelliae]